MLAIIGHSTSVFLYTNYFFMCSFQCLFPFQLIKWCNGESIEKLPLPLNIYTDDIHHPSNLSSLPIKSSGTYVQNKLAIDQTLSHELIQIDASWVFDMSYIWYYLSTYDICTFPLVEGNHSTSELRNYTSGLFLCSTFFCFLVM